MHQITGEQYDALNSSSKDYAAEARELTGLICERAPHAASLLDMACGTGAHMEFLAPKFSVSGVDLDTRLLAAAHRRVPTAPLYVADMCSVDLGRRFDVVTCLFNSIGYAGTYEALEATIANFARHLQPGGCVIVDGWVTPDAWNADQVHHTCAESPGQAITRVDRSEIRGRNVKVFAEYLIATPRSIKHVSEVHETGLFTRNEYVSAFRKARLTCEVLDNALTRRGVYVGRWSSRNRA